MSERPREGELWEYRFLSGKRSLFLVTRIWPTSSCANVVSLASGVESEHAFREHSFNEYGWHRVTL